MEKFIINNYMFKDSEHPAQIEIYADCIENALKDFSKKYNYSIIKSIYTDKDQCLYDARFNDIHTFIGYDDI